MVHYEVDTGREKNEWMGDKTSETMVPDPRVSVNVEVPHSW